MIQGAGFDERVAAGQQSATACQIQSVPSPKARRSRARLRPWRRASQGGRWLNSKGGPWPLTTTFSASTPGGGLFEAVIDADLLFVPFHAVFQGLFAAPPRPAVAHLKTVQPQHAQRAGRPLRFLFHRDGGRSDLGVIYAWLMRNGTARNWIKVNQRRLLQLFL